MSGFIKVYRSFFDHWTWTKGRIFSEAEAWLDLVQSANWQPGKQLVNGQLFDVDRGQLLASDRYLQNRWKWKSLSRVQTFLKTVTADGMLRSEDLGKTSRRTICNYSLYNTSEVSEKSQEGQSEVTEQVTERSVKGHTAVKSKKEEIKKEEIRKETPQAGGFEFEKLANSVGRTCAKLLIEGEVGKHLEEGKRKLLRQWLTYRHEKGSPITTTTELFEILEEFKTNELAALTAACKKSYKAGWKVMVIEKPKDATPNFPNYWQPGIEAKENMTPEQTIKYHQQLMAMGWYKTTEQGQPYWNRPQKNGSRTGETTLAGAMKN